MAVNSGSVVQREYTNGAGQIVTLESLDGTLRDDGTRRSPRLCVGIRDRGRAVSWMPTHDDLLQMLWFYRSNDEQWPRLRNLVFEVMSTDQDSCPTWQGGGRR